MPEQDPVWSSQPNISRVLSPETQPSPRVQAAIERARNDARVDAVLLPYPKGDLICRKC